MIRLMKHLLLIALAFRKLIGNVDFDLATGIGVISGFVGDRGANGVNCEV